DLIQQLLTFGRGGAPVKKAVSIARFLEDAVRGALIDSEMRCDFDLGAGLWPVEIDEGQMGQVIYNLVRNAQEAMPEGGNITVRAENVVFNESRHLLPLRAEWGVKIAIPDEGVGIRQANLSKIFDAYFTTKAEASGLGLAACYAIVSSHGGSVSVETNPGGVAADFREHGFSGFVAKPYDINDLVQVLHDALTREHE